ncbi:hypothetical protein [Roseibacillus persicicus]|uniref:hypothetical protein n=1 Tax=Roseibacillus persicicus TaxID=454148 RepID=UPI00280D0F28|nr:hypothetical protein [Roseibacillus persicicus]MDQ8192654.1 hypothetical protein [Roseibacillus persicicus]
MNLRVPSSHCLILALQTCVLFLLNLEAVSETVGRFTLEDLQPAGGQNFEVNLPRKEGVKLDVVEAVKKSDEFLKVVLGLEGELEFHSASLRGQVTQDGMVWIWQICYIHPESEVKSRLFNPRLLGVRLQLNGELLTRVVPETIFPNNAQHHKSDRAGELED